MNKLTTLTKAQIEAQFPGLLSSIGCKDSSNSRFLVVPFTKKRLFAENSPALQVTALHVPLDQNSIPYVNSVTKSPVNARSNQEFTINELGTVYSLGHAMILWFENLWELYEVPEGERPEPTPSVKYKLNITGPVTNPVINGVAGSEASAGVLIYTLEALELTSVTLNYALSKVSYLGQEFIPFHNSSVASEDLEIGDYKFTIDLIEDSERATFQFSSIQISIRRTASELEFFELYLSGGRTGLMCRSEVLPL